MPNHVVNRITGPDFTRFVTKNDKEALVFDFNQFVPQPETLFNGSVSSQVQGAAEIALGLLDLKALQHKGTFADTWQDKGADAMLHQLHQSNNLRQLTEGKMVKDFSDKDFEEFVAMIRSYRDNGCFSWYDWSPKNWGTKWNAYDVRQVSPTVLVFETAWSAPHPVIEQLAHITNECFTHEWADEDTGHNVGYRTYGGGKIQEEEELSKQKRGFELAIELHKEEEYWNWDEAKEEYVSVDEDY